MNEFSKFMLLDLLSVSNTLVCSDMLEVACNCIGMMVNKKLQLCETFRCKYKQSESTLS